MGANQDMAFIRTETLDALVKGSFEDMIKKAQDLVLGNLDKFNVGPEATATVVATFPTFMIVATSDAHLFKAEFANGVLGKVDPVDNAVVAKENVQSVAMEIAGQAVRNLATDGKFNEDKMDELVSVQRMIDV